MDDLYIYIYIYIYIYLSCSTVRTLSYENYGIFLLEIMDKCRVHNQQP